jgi:uncharacterized metal-binding protein
MTNDPLNQVLLLTTVLTAIIFFVTIPAKQPASKRTRLRKEMWQEYNAISRIILGAVTLAGLHEVSDRILDMRKQYRRVRDIEKYSSALFAKLFNREAELRRMKFKV